MSLESAIAIDTPTTCFAAVGGLAKLALNYNPNAPIVYPDTYKPLT